MSCDSAANAQSPESWTPPKNELRDTTKMLAREQVVLLSPFSDNANHSIVLRKPQIARINPTLEMQ